MIFKTAMRFASLPLEGEGGPLAVDEVDQKLSKIKESETPETTSSVTYGASFPY